MKYITAANRDRDHYQVPLALDERDQLAAHVTDYYVGASRPSIARLSHRQVAGLDASLVHPASLSFAVQAFQQWARAMGAPINHPARTSDFLIERKVLQVARQLQPEGLLLYSGCASYVFPRYPAMFRALFQFHPSPGIVREALQADELGAVGSWLPEPEENRSRRKDREHDVEIAFADHAIVASGFTRRGLIADGFPVESITVAPYGMSNPNQGSVRIDRATSQSPRSSSPGPKFLFVGQGVRRKGLHLLLEAWRQARIRGASLTIVASRMDPAIASMARSLDDVEITTGLTDAALAALMDLSDTLVLPSLVEGFGLVIGEALARGQRVIASTNTGLPDYDPPREVGLVVEAGLVYPIVEALREHADTWAPDRAWSEHSYNLATKWNWSRFRKLVVSNLR